MISIAVRSSDLTHCVEHLLHFPRIISSLFVSCSSIRVNCILTYLQIFEHSEYSLIFDMFELFLKKNSIIWNFFVIKKNYLCRSLFLFLNETAKTTIL